MKLLTYVLKKEKRILTFKRFYENEELITQVKKLGIEGEFEIQRAYKKHDREYIYWNAYVNKKGKIFCELFPTIKD